MIYSGQATHNAQKESLIIGPNSEMVNDKTVRAILDTTQRGDNAFSPKPQLI